MTQLTTPAPALQAGPRPVPMEPRPSFCAVPTPTLIYAGPRTLEEFERIALPENTPGPWRRDDLFGWRADSDPVMEARIRSKTLGAPGDGKPAVIFQWREYRPEAAGAGTAAAGEGK